MAIKQFIVIGRRIAAVVDGNGIAGFRVGVGSLPCLGICVVRNVRKECMLARHCQACCDGCRRITFNHCIQSGYELGKAIRAGDEVAVKVGCEERNAMHIHVAKFDTQHFTCLRLDVCPSWRTTFRTGKKPACCNRLAVDQLIFAQEHLMRCMRCIGLVKVNPWCCVVGRFADIVGCANDTVWTRLVCCAGQNHEVGWATWDVKGIFWLKRNEYRPASALFNAGQAMIEELPKNGHETIEWRGRTKVSHDVRNDKVAILHFDTGEQQQVFSRCNRSVAGSVGVDACLASRIARVKNITASWLVSCGERCFCFEQCLVCGDDRSDSNACGISSTHDAVIQRARSNADAIERSDNGNGVG